MSAAFLHLRREKPRIALGRHPAEIQRESRVWGGTTFVIRIQKLQCSRTWEVPLPRWRPASFVICIPSFAETAPSRQMRYPRIPRQSWGRRARRGSGCPLTPGLRVGGGGGSISAIQRVRFVWRCTGTPSQVDIKSSTRRNGCRRQGSSQSRAGDHVSSTPSCGCF